MARENFYTYLIKTDGICGSASLFILANMKKEPDGITNTIPSNDQV